MRVVIMGCGRVGSQLANILSLDGHDVRVIDMNPESFKRLNKSFKGEKIIGFGFDREVVEKAGIKNADAFASVTNGDNRNIVGALIAKKEYHVPMVVTRIYDPVRASVYQKLGIATISPTTWAANEIKELICHPHMLSQLSFGNGEVELVEVEVTHSIAGHLIKKINVPGEIVVTAVTRLGSAFVPVDGTVMQEGDILHIAVMASAISQLERMLGI